MKSDSLDQFSRLYSTLSSSSMPIKPLRKNDSDCDVYPYKHHHHATNNYGFASSQMKCTLTSDLWQAISALLCCVMIIKCFKAVDQVVRGALGPDQPIWSPLLLSAPGWLFPCGLEIMASNIWGLVDSEREAGTANREHRKYLFGYMSVWDVRTSVCCIPAI